MAKTQREILKFEDDQAIEVKFDFDTEGAKSYTRETPYGTKTSFGIAVNGTQILFASEALYNKINGYKKGDSATITFADKKWEVQSSAERNVTSTVKAVNGDETLVLLRSINTKLDKLLGNHAPETTTTTETAPEADEAEGFGF